LSAPPPRPRILVINDDQAVASLMARLLDHAGYDALVATNGEADFPALSRVDPPLDLVLVNSYLPRLSGSEIVARVAEFFTCCPVLHIEQGGVPFNAERLLSLVRKAHQARYTAPQH
jgi:DNA-binding response OmpR family regulator